MQLHWNNIDEFPIVKSANNLYQSPNIETFTETIMHIIEQATQRLETLTNQISKKFNIETNEISSKEAEKSHNRKTKHDTIRTTRNEKNGNQTII
jgi:hypothetical protein